MLGASVRTVRWDDSHVPERAQALIPAGAAAAAAFDPHPWLARQPRPLRLLPRPWPVGAVDLVPDGPPLRLGCWTVTTATGPERILPEWWRPEDLEARLRDHHRITSEDG